MARRSGSAATCPRTRGESGRPNSSGPSSGDDPLAELSGGRDAVEIRIAVSSRSSGVSPHWRLRVEATSTCDRGGREASRRGSGRHRHSVARGSRRRAGDGPPALPRPPTASGIAWLRRCAETSKKRARCRLTTFSRLMSHSSELGRHRGIPRPARVSLPDSVRQQASRRLCLVASRPSSPEPPVQEGWAYRASRFGKPRAGRSRQARGKVGIMPVVIFSKLMRRLD